MRIFILYVLIINLYGFYIMFADKRKSVKGQWRIPEARLFGVAAALGSPGILAGMYTFRHKTKHLKFVLGIPAILLVEIYVFYRFRYLYLK
jgi:uncharacterized membrane protein YsdA (DUF1294 family)